MKFHPKKYIFWTLVYMVIYFKGSEKV